MGGSLTKPGIVSAAQSPGRTPMCPTALHTYIHCRLWIDGRI